MSHPTLPNPEPERELIHFDPGHRAEIAPCGFDLGVQGPDGWTTDPAKVTCAACRAALLDEDEQQSARHLREERLRQDYLDGDDFQGEPLADASSWAAATDAELEQRLRDSRTYVDRVLGGLDAATPAAADLADMVARTGVHYDPGTLERLTLCDLTVPELAPEDVTAALAAVTCPTCSAGLVDSQLPPEPVVAERRTVGLEVLTDELRQQFDVWGTRGSLVGIVCRRNDEPVDVPEVQTLWEAPFRKAPDVLGQMLRQARMYADGLDGQTGAELLMPGPEVLAALAGQPVGSYTKPVPSSYGYVQPGWFVLTETFVQGRGDFVWLLVESREECKDWRDCAVAGGQDGVCHVVTVRGRGVQHLESWRPVHVRIPATTEVER